MSPETPENIPQPKKLTGKEKNVNKGKSKKRTAKDEIKEIEERAKDGQEQATVTNNADQVVEVAPVAEVVVPTVEEPALDEKTLKNRLGEIDTELRGKENAVGPAIKKLREDQARLTAELARLSEAKKSPVAIAKAKENPPEVKPAPATKTPYVKRARSVEAKFKELEQGEAPADWVSDGAGGWENKNAKSPRRVEALKPASEKAVEMPKVLTEEEQREQEAKEKEEKRLVDLAEKRADLGIVKTSSVEVPTVPELDDAVETEAVAQATGEVSKYQNRLTEDQELDEKLNHRGRFERLYNWLVPSEMSQGIKDGKARIAEDGVDLKRAQEKLAEVQGKLEAKQQLIRERADQLSERREQAMRALDTKGFPQFLAKRAGEFDPTADPEQTLKLFEAFNVKAEVAKGYKELAAGELKKLLGWDTGPGGMKALALDRYMENLAVENPDELLGYQKLLQDRVESEQLIKEAQVKLPEVEKKVSDREDFLKLVEQSNRFWTGLGSLYEMPWWLFAGALIASAARKRDPKHFEEVKQARAKGRKEGLSGSATKRGVTVGMKSALERLAVEKAEIDSLKEGQQGNAKRAEELERFALESKALKTVWESAKELAIKELEGLMGKNDLAKLEEAQAFFNKLKNGQEGDRPLITYFEGDDLKDTQEKLDVAIEKLLKAGLREALNKVSFAGDGALSKLKQAIDKYLKPLGSRKKDEVTKIIKQELNGISGGLGGDQESKAKQILLKALIAGLK